MSSTATSGSIDYRVECIENCRFFNRKDAKITLIIAQETLGGYNAVVLKDENGKREPVLSATAPTALDALRALFQKSCEAVQNYISINSFNHVPALNKRGRPSKKGKSSDDSDSDAWSSCSSVRTLSLDEDSSSGSSSSGEDAISIGPSRKQKAKKNGELRGRSRHSPKAKASGKSSKKTGLSRSRSRSQSRTSSTDSLRRVLPRQKPARLICNAPAQVQATSVPPPPPGWGSRNPSMVHLSMTQQGNNTSIPLPAMRPGGNYPMMPVSPPNPLPPVVGIKPPSPPGSPPAPIFDVRLHIRWKGHGEKLILEQSPASVRSIQDKALSWVRRNLATFKNLSNFDLTPARMAALCARVRQATIDGDNYDMGSYGSDDLRKLMRVAGINNIPRFEIEIEAISSPAPNLRPLSVRPSAPLVPRELASLGTVE